MLKTAFAAKVAAAGVAELRCVDEVGRPPFGSSLSTARGPARWSQVIHVQLLPSDAAGPDREASPRRLATRMNEISTSAAAQACSCSLGSACSADVEDEERKRRERLARIVADRVARERRSEEERRGLAGDAGGRRASRR